ncbi:MAG: DUF917 family protein [Chloroflexota bacterium]
MGRAFPEIQQVTMHLAGIKASPAVVVDERDAGHDPERRTEGTRRSAWSGRSLSRAAASRRARSTA